ncbi:hypothetical protein Fcan01_16862 [Folsomia candida]|uniref:Beta,beta-carotene 9',10'-oxygenase n=1 Tax=Folsomia candida TaxID=158441 RepID=A0A226DRU9_FOLCA|nr:hypothetical protein Fcan01_16862 [Folsomia candida]
MATRGNKVKVFKSLKETRKAEVAKIIGEIPEWATGQILRSCPAKLNHVHDGYLMITKFEVVGGKTGSVAFTSKFLQSEAFKKAEAEQKPIISEFYTRTAGSDAKSALGKIVSSMIPKPTDNCQYICTSDICRNPIVTNHAGFMFEVDPKTLHTVSRYDSAAKDNLYALSSHPLTDPETGETNNVGLDMIPTTKWKVVKYPPKLKSSSLQESLKKGKIIGSHPCRYKVEAPYLHSFGMSKNFVLWIDEPCHFNSAQAIKLVFKGFCQREVMDWYPKRKNQFYIFDKNTHKVVKTEIFSKDPFFFLHILNCYEENNHLIVDLFSMRNIQFMDIQLVTKLRTGNVLKDPDCPRLLRYVIPLNTIEDQIGKFPENKNLVKLNSTGKAVRIGDKIILEPEVISDLKMDFPTWNERFYGKQLRFFWATGAFCASRHQNKIIKFDLHTRKYIIWDAGGHQYVGEPTFIGKPNSALEDDGLIVVTVVNYTETDEKDFVVWLDSKNLKEVGRAYFDCEIPIGIHSVWLSK